MGNIPPLTPAQDRALACLREAAILDDLYLAGGVGVAIYLGHRQSVDLDFISFATHTRRSLDSRMAQEACALQVSETSRS